MPDKLLQRLYFKLYLKLYTVHYVFTVLLTNPSDVLKRHFTLKGQQHEFPSPFDGKIL
jgi:hypothetical protein